MSDTPYDPAPLILTLALDPAAQERLDRLREAYFPTERNHLRAHLTLFHHLPADHEAAIRADLTAVGAATGPLTLRATEVRFFGQGVAYGFAAPELAALRERLARVWWPELTAQDRRPFRPHVTVQNKVAAARARALYEELRAGFVPFTIIGAGLLLWRYRGGPWEAAGSYPFAAAPPTTAESGRGGDGDPAE